MWTAHLIIHQENSLYDFDPLKPHFYIVKLGVYRGIHYFSYFCSKHRLWVLVRTALWGPLMMRNWPTLSSITKTRLFQYIEHFTSKNWRTSDKENSDIFFHISAQNIGCGYSLEPPRRGGSNKYPQFMFLRRNKKNNVYPCKPQFYYIKVGLKGVKII